MCKEGGKMSTNLKITGGILFGVLSEAMIVNPKSTRMYGNNEGPKHENTCNLPKLLSYLAGIAGNEYSNIKKSDVASDYKKCNGQGSVGLDKDPYKIRFNKLMAENYNLALLRTQKLFQECIFNDEEIRLNLAKRIYWLLTQTNRNYSFIYNGKQYGLKEFLAIKKYDFYFFFLGVWHSVSTSIQNNKNQETFDFLFKNNGYKTEYYFYKDASIQFNDLIFDNLLSPNKPIVIDEAVEIKEDIKKEPQPDKEEAQIEICEKVETAFEETKESPQPQVNTGIISYGENATNIVNNGFMTLNIGVKKNDQ